MAKRRSKKTAISKRKKLAKSAKSDSTVSLSGRRHAYRWRYLQLIKEGLVWLTGKRTRGVRMSESAIAASKKTPKRRSQRKATRAASLRFKVVRGMFEEGGKKKKKHAGKRTVQRKRGPKGMRMHGNARPHKAVGLKRGHKINPKSAGTKRNTTKRGRKPTRGRPKKPRASDSESTYDGLIYSPTRLSYAQSSKRKGPKSKSRQGTSKSGRKQGAHKSIPKRAGGTKAANFSSGPRAGRIVTRSVSRQVLPRNQIPKKTVSPGRSHVKMVTPGRDASGSTIFV